jgi:hypothetical protein
VASTAVDFLSSDEAVADSYWVYYVETNCEPRVALVGHYHDILRRTEDGWKMARREITFG